MNYARLSLPAQQSTGGRIAPESEGLKIQSPCSWTKCKGLQKPAKRKRVAMDLRNKNDAYFSNNDSAST